METSSRVTTDAEHCTVDSITRGTGLETAILTPPIRVAPDVIFSQHFRAVEDQYLQAYTWSHK